MTVLKCFLFYGLLLFITLQAADQEDVAVSLSPKYAYPYIVLVCTVRSTNAKQYSAYLKCPFGVNQICYQNCNAACTTKGCIAMITKCAISSTNNNFLQIEWTIDTTMVNRSGEWKCAYRNLNSNSFNVMDFSFVSQQESSKPPIVTVKTPTTTKHIEYFHDIVTTTENPGTISPVLPENNPIYQDNDNTDFWNFIRKPNVVLILVCIFTASLLFNIVFLIRCALLRSIIDQYMQFNKISDSCLYRCFCIRINDGLPPFKTKTLPQAHPPNAFVGYHREDVYDDMSASSQAERHLINNYSQYELEQDSLKARKFWSTDGSQSLLGRQSQFYQGQPMSNYVIVSGPVCSNKNHGPFIPASNINFLSNSQRTCVTDDMAKSAHDSHKNESSICNDSIIYSQPMKNRPKSLGQFTDVDSIKLKETCPPAPPIRTCTDNQCYRTSNPCVENMQKSVLMKNVDLIEHCAHSTVINTPQENLS